MRGTIVAVVLCVLAGTASAQITQAQARKVALARIPGTVVHEKLKHEKKKHGHDHWNIKIEPRDQARRGVVKKVEIDAETGAILKIKEVKAKGDD